MKNLLKGMLVAAIPITMATHVASAQATFPSGPFQVTTALSFFWDPTNVGMPCDGKGDDCSYAVTARVEKVVPVSGNIKGIHLVIEGGTLNTPDGIIKWTPDVDKTGKQRITLGKIVIPGSILGTSADVKVLIEDAPFDPKTGLIILKVSIP